MYVLGLSGCFSPPHEDLVAGLPNWFFHDASAVLLRDGEVVAAVEEERASRIKHTNRFPGRAVQICLEEAGIRLGDVDRIAFCFKEEYSDKELYHQYVEHPAAPLDYSRELVGRRLRERFRVDFPAERIEFVAHHVAHGYCAFLQSGFDEALVAVLDGNGDDASTTIYTGKGQELTRLFSKPSWESLGHFYSTGTELLGYGLFDEYKVMGLAPYGDPARYREIFRELGELRPDGDFDLGVSRLRTTFHRSGFRPRRKGEPFDAAHADFAAGLQEELERLAGHLLAHWRQVTGQQRIAIAGGVGLNCTHNGKLLRGGLFEEVFVHPAAHDAGAALGAALKVHADTAGEAPARRVRQVFWGRGLDEDETRSRLHDWRDFLDFRRSDRVAEEAAESLADGRIVGWVQGRSEFGPRALGNRSILADPRPADNRERVNKAIKKREGYRPFAPSVLAERLPEFFEFPENAPTPDFMVFSVPVREDKREQLGAVTHVDGSARVHAVAQEVNPAYWRLLSEFGRLTGIPIVLNTSFNNNAEPIVDTVDDAIQCFLTTELDALFVGDHVVTKREPTRSSLLGLHPVLVEHAALRTTTRPGAEPAASVEFTFTGGGSRPVSVPTHRVLARADGTRPLRELVDPAADPGPVLDQVLDLWQARYVRLSPTPVRG
ncbi:carbamoyltransferase C-terminal domain-containing protein [Saccharopolyspora sp. NPDC050642]|uniref:carbamoyltransferase family protein n=1 Tax=Saccharopolyspora sp. NPDC050642 TaxID=3157099 RepID=UPI0033DD1381